MSDTPTGDAWNWLKTAPLPVVLAICLLAIVVSLGYTKSISNENQLAAKAALAKADEAKELARTTASTDYNVRDKLRTLDIKLDALLEKSAETSALIKQHIEQTRKPKP